jgi:hypothetical protein
MNIYEFPMLYGEDATQYIKLDNVASIEPVSSTFYTGSDFGESFACFYLHLYKGQPLKIRYGSGTLLKCPQ